jgi:hypothetical protein
MKTERPQYDIGTAVKFFLAGMGLGAVLSVIFLPSPARHLAGSASTGRGGRSAA